MKFFVLVEDVVKVSEGLGIFAGNGYCETISSYVMSDECGTQEKG